MMKYMHQYKQKKKEKDEHFGFVAKIKLNALVDVLESWGKREGREFESRGLQTHEFFFFSFFPPTSFFFLFLFPMKLISALHL